MASSEFPGRPRLQKGALAVYPTQTPGSQPSQIILFQFNPDQMRRQLAYRTPPASQSNTPPGQAKEDALRVSGPPVETITISVDMNAADQLEAPYDNDNAIVAQYGLHPALATLEMLMYPPTQDVQQATQDASQGAVQIQTADIPLVLFVWGSSRVVPVKIISFSVTEDQFDTRLNPISAKVDLGMQVLTYIEFPDSSVGHDTFMSYQQQKQNLAGMAPPGDTSGIRNLLP